MLFFFVLVFFLLTFNMFVFNQKHRPMATETNHAANSTAATGEIFIFFFFFLG